jgi:hypothetical protein
MKGTKESLEMQRQEPSKTSIDPTKTDRRLYITTHLRSTIPCASSTSISLFERNEGRKKEKKTHHLFQFLPSRLNPVTLLLELDLLREPLDEELLHFVVEVACGRRCVKFQSRRKRRGESVRRRKMEERSGRKTHWHLRGERRSNGIEGTSLDRVFASSRDSGLEDERERKRENRW